MQLWYCLRFVSSYFFEKQRLLFLFLFLSFSAYTHSFVSSQIHEIIDGRSDRTVFKTPFAFRLLYNGKVLTSLVKGCPENSDLCDVRFLKEIVDKFATRDMDCTPPDIKSNLVLQEAATVLSTVMGILIFLGLVLVSAVFGALVAYMFLMGRFRRRGRKAIPSRTAEDADEIGVREKQFQDEPSDDLVHA